MVAAWTFAVGAAAEEPNAPTGLSLSLGRGTEAFLQAQATRAQTGFRNTWGSGIDTRVSAWSSRTGSENRFTADEAWSELARAGMGHGVTLSMRYEPARWLALDMEATVARARFGDGAREPVPGAAERFAAAGATLRGVGGWTARLFVTYLGPRTATDDEALRLRSSSLVNAQVASRLSKKTRVTFDVFNVFNQPVGEIDQFAAARLIVAPGSMDSFLFHPAEPRGFRLNLRTTF